MVQCARHMCLIPMPIWFANGIVVGARNSLIYTILMKPIRLICLTVDYEYKGTILGGLS